MQALPAPAESLCIVEMGGSEGEAGEKPVSGGLFLNIGLQVCIKQHANSVILVLHEHKKLMLKY